MIDLLIIVAVTVVACTAVSLPFVLLLRRWDERERQNARTIPRRDLRARQ